MQLILFLSLLVSVSANSQFIADNVIDEIDSRFVQLETPVMFYMGTCLPEDVGYMGCTVADVESTGVIDETRHIVSLTKPFEIMKTEVTQRQYYWIVRNSQIGTNPTPSHHSLPPYCPEDTEQILPGVFICPNHPVERISWYEAKNFAALLNGCPEIDVRPNGMISAEAMTRATLKRQTECTQAKIEAQEVVYDLPSEAQWEYAARAGSNFAYSFGPRADFLARFAWYSDSSVQQTHSVAKKQANVFGLFDMHGNVSEWVNDWMGLYPERFTVIQDPIGSDSGEFRVFRGGNFGNEPEKLRSAVRIYYTPNIKEFGLGFRLVKIIPNFEPF